MATNGNGLRSKIILVIVGSIITIFIGGYFANLTMVQKALADNVIENDKLSRKRDTKIIEDFHEIEKENGNKFETIKGQLTKAETNQEWMQKALIDIKELIKNGN